MSIRVKNKTNKVVVVGKYDILPDNVVELPEEEYANPIVKLFIAKGLLIEIPQAFEDEPVETVEEKALNVDKMKKAELIEECEKRGIATEGLTVAKLKQALLEALA